MRKVTTLLLALFLAATSAVGASAQQVADLAQAPESAQQARQASVEGRLPAAAVAQAQFALAKDAQQARQATRRAPAARAVSLDALEGKRVMTYSSLVTTLGDGGSSVTIKKLSADSIELQNFWTKGINVHAAVDAATGKVTIPNQQLYVHSTYGPIDLACINHAGKPDRTVQLEGSIDASGNLTIDTWWAAWVVSGDKKDNFLVAGYKTLIEKSNGSMHVTYYNDGNGADPDEDWNVIVEQKGKNLVAVKNFGNHGKTIEVVLKSDSTISIASQLVYAGGATMGDFYTLGITDGWKDGGKTTGFINGTGTTRQLSFGSWVMFSANKYYTGKLNSGVITPDAGFTFEYPSAPSESFSGSGTEADPYQVKTIEDLVAMANKVNNDTERNWGGPNVFHTKTYQGKVFKLMNDIDMGGYRFDPIGNSWNQRFAGTFDGAGHTLKNLDVNTGASGYAALFGMCDTTAVIKNLNITDAKVSGEGYYAAIVGGFVLGKIENCHTTGTVTNSGICAAGIVALGWDVSNCSYSGTITANGGMGGGIAGQVYGAIEDCHASGRINVGAPADTYCGGGIVGTLFGSTSACRTSYFTGIVDGTLHSNLYLGGVVGQVFRGTVDRCFAQADVYGFDTQAAVGGVVGVVQGKVSNSYFNGAVTSASSRTVGGIAGSVRYASYTGESGKTEVMQSEIKNCYFAGRLRAESYLYDADTEVRETLGQIYTGATPTVENIYYDRQMVPGFGSKHYAALTSELTGAAGPAGFPADAWTFTEGYYPRIKGIDNNAVAELSASVLKFDNAFPDNTNYVSANVGTGLLGSTKVALYVDNKISLKGHCGSIEDGTYKIGTESGSDTIVFYSADANLRPRFYALKVAPKFFEGAGTEANPFLIRNKADLMRLGDLTSNVEQYFANTYFLQTADIDMENDTSFTGICNSLTNAAKCRFAGTYDGGGHAIHNMHIDYMSWKVEPTDSTFGTPDKKGPRTSIYKGFVGSLESSGVIKNLTIAADCRYDVWGYAGAFVGYNYGTVENCKNFATLYSYSSTVGGIVGNNNPGGLVKGCFNGGAVYTGFTTAGGIVGTNGGGVIEECMNVGDIEVKPLSTFEQRDAKLRYAGGISGSSMGGVVRNCVNAGHVYAQGGMVAGLSASFNSTIVHDGNNDVYNTINYGTLFTKPAYVGTTGNIGANGYNAAAKIQNFYYDAQLTGLNAAANDACPGATAATTAQLTSGEALDGFDTSLWQFAKGQYPVLKRFATEPQAVAASQIVLTVADGQTVKALKTDATVSAPEGATLKLAKADKFSLSGSTLKVPAVTEFAYDTLTVAYNGFARPIALMALKPVPLKGEGSEADPYQIATTDDWNNFADYMAESQNSFDGRYVKLMNDIDFASAKFTPMAYDGITAFGATMLGAGHTVKGISYTATNTYQGVFCKQGLASEIRDLTLEGTLKSAKANTGGFAGIANGKFVNCVNKLDVDVTAAGAGGFAAQAGGKVEFRNCINNAVVVGTKGTLGGFVANALAGVKFINCQNNGTVVNNGSGKYVAGFAAQGTAPLEFRNCVNTAEINARTATVVAGFVGYVQAADTVKLIGCHNDGDLLGASSVAGLVGSPNTAYNSTRTPLYIDSCYNTATVQSLTKATYGTAGLASIITPHSVIKNSYNTGSILSTQAVYTGGLWGDDLDPRSDDEAIYVTNCYNTGDVAGVNYGGGIAGSVPAYTHISYCYNTGDISATLGAGGIGGGFMGNYITVDHCWNSGQVSTTKNGAGGINGYGNYRIEVSNSFNTGNVACGTTGAGGLGGQTRASYTNCYNTGAVSGPESVGGLVGQTAAVSVSPGTNFYKCYNAGKVTSESTTLVGNLIGTSGAKNWDPAANAIENCYFVTDFGTFDADTIGGTAVTVAQLAKATDLAGQWSFGNDYELPVLPEFADLDNAKASAAAVVLQEGDTFGNVTRSFHVGTPAGVEWTVSNPVIKITDNWASVTDASTDEVQLTATCGGFKHVWTVKLNVASGVDANVADKAVVAERYFTVAGIEVAKPVSADGQAYIVLRTYSDGTTQAVKVLNR